MSSLKNCYMLIQINIFIINLLCLNFILGNSYDGPKIFSEYETILEVNQNHTVTCEGHEKLIWILPEIKSIKTRNEYTKFIVENIVPSTYTYGLKLTIINMTYNFVGFYNCVYYDNKEKQATIYLYVSDNDHFALNTETHTIFAMQYENIVIPCKPTSPDVQVSLWTSKRKEVLLQTLNKYSTTYDYNPLYGFFTNDTKRVINRMFRCIFKKDGIHRIEEQSVNLVVEPPNVLAVPYIEIVDGTNTAGGHLKLKCSVDSKSQYITFEWLTPSGQIDTNRMHKSKTRRDKKHSWIYETLNITETSKIDNGDFRCTVSDNQGHVTSSSKNIKIYDINEHFMYLSGDEFDYCVLNKTVGDEVQWLINVTAYPEPKFTWLDNKNITIEMGETIKHKTEITNQQIILTIKNIDLSDFGNYTLLADNNFEIKKRKLLLRVSGKPLVQFESNKFLIVNEENSVKCKVTAYPLPDIHWEYKLCFDNTCNFMKTKGYITEERITGLDSMIEFNPTDSGIIKCVANNTFGTEEQTFEFFVTDVTEGFGIIQTDDNIDFEKETKHARVALNDTISLTCAASIYNYSHLYWINNEEIINATDKYDLQTSYGRYSNKVSLTILNLEFNDSGIYSCMLLQNNSEIFTENVTLKVASPCAPLMNESNQEILINMPEEMILTCEFYGVPKPIIKWFKNDLPFNPENSSRISMNDDKKFVKFKSTEFMDEATYRCEVTNKFGSTSKIINVYFENNPKVQLYYWIICSLGIFVCLAMFYISYKLRKELKLKSELREMGLAHFEKGAIENFNPELGIDDQADLLPYDRKWEYPRENLKLGKQLGSGAFGVVVKAEAKSISDDEETTTVAVKMAKKNADNACIKALSSELKILVHLGKHVNVVNILGACTKNVAKRELLVIVEYCRYGNLQNYLFRHRGNFLNQIDPNTGLIDFDLSKEIFERTYSNSSVGTTNTEVSSPNQFSDYKISFSSDSAILPSTNITSNNLFENPRETDNVVILSNNSEWRTNKNDFKEINKPLSTSDLLVWSFQVARGMEYLSSRSVLHGDLAARNILLSDNNIVKICDFGLAKNLYKSDNYKKKGNGPLPIKWMAIESIRDRIFSTESDVWSFGIVLWEFFSLAKTPYPGMEANEDLYNKLVRGYRMEKPLYAPQKMYELMCKCWDNNPKNRPSFKNLSSNIGELLEENVRQHYVDLNNPYREMNLKQFRETENDYLAMLTPPNFENISSPNYVNENVGCDYLFMKSPSEIRNSDSTNMDDEVFTFEETERVAQNNDNQIENELYRQKCFSNPSYHLFPKNKEKIVTKEEVNTTKLNNYVNISVKTSHL